MNSFGRLFRVSILGESHGARIGVLIDGCPAGLPLSPEDMREDLDRRRAGAKGTTPRKESDIPTIETGLFNGRTTGAPLLITFPNGDVDSSSYEAMRSTPRPGHADFVAHQKFGGFEDYRGGGHFSGRLTAALVAAGVVAKRLIAPVVIRATLLEVGGRGEIQEAVDEAVASGDSIGGVCECRATGLSVGLGEPFFDSVESLIAHAVFAIPAIRGIEFGAGFGSARMKGSECNDALSDADGATLTNNAGGVNGGIANGNELVFRIAVKPTSSIAKEQQTYNRDTNALESFVVKGRHDACIALRVPPVLEAVTAIVLADLSMIEQRVKRVQE
ncbi:MAG: chorismate synthase [Deltaproteobacteria bacterium]|nr:chorismate synthase [Deltaproteobacteria bacterium]